MFDLMSILELNLVGKSLKIPWHGRHFPSCIELFLPPLGLGVLGKFLNGADSRWQPLRTFPWLSKYYPNCQKLWPRPICHPSCGLMSGRACGTAWPSRSLPCRSRHCPVDWKLIMSWMMVTNQSFCNIHYKKFYTGCKIQTETGSQYRILLFFQATWNLTLQFHATLNFPIFPSRSGTSIFSTISRKFQTYRY